MRFNLFNRNIKPIIKKDNEPTNGVDERKRESSPGLAKISALVTGPPKPKIQTSMYDMFKLQFYKDTLI